MNEKRKNEYHNSEKADKEGWLVQFVIDPENAMLQGFNKTAAYTETKNKAAEVWVTEEQLGLLPDRGNLCW